MKNFVFFSQTNTKTKQHDWAEGAGENKIALGTCTDDHMAILPIFPQNVGVYVHV